MRILILNPPHTAIGSRIPDDQLPPLGLLSIGGSLIDAGYDTHLIDGDYDPMSLEQLVQHAWTLKPDIVMVGHTGSTSAHPTIVTLCQRLHKAMPDVTLIYGGVFPTYHWQDVLEETPPIHYIVKGEGEETIVNLVDALKAGTDVGKVAGIAYRKQGKAVATPPAPMIADLDACRVGWELIDLKRYSYWGGKQAVVIQFSRGCPHLCNYCGQRGFWTKWRHRDPKKLAAEMAWLHREHGVEMFNFADENPSAGRKPWLAFLRALIAHDLELTLVGSTRAGDIVRDADQLHLYKQAGFERFLLGMENTDEDTLKLIKKGGTTAQDREAIGLLRKHKILSMATWVTGFEEERFSDLWRGFRQILSYDPDQIQALYVTPHRWTPFYRLAKDRKIIQPDRKKWDYKHQVMAVKHMHPLFVLVCVKMIEMMAQMRPRALWRLFFYPDAKIRHAMRWYYKMGRRVWFREIFHFFFYDTHLKAGPTLAQFWGRPQEQDEEAMSKVRPQNAPQKTPVQDRGVGLYLSPAVQASPKKDLKSGTLSDKS